MPPSAPHITSQLRQLIYYHLDNNLIRSALFLAGRLHAFEPRSSEAAYLLALCYLQSGQPKAAWEYSRNSGTRGTHLGCSYVFAQACLDLGNYVEGITALERSRNHWTSRNTWNKHSENRRQYLPDAAAVLCLQGRLWHAHKDLNKAIDCYTEALRLNPFLWDAFLGLCKTGADIRVPNIYKMTSDMLASLPASPASDSSSSAEKVASTNGPLQAQPNANNNTDPFVSATSRGDGVAGGGSSALWEKFNGSNVTVGSLGSPIGEGTETPTARSDLEDNQPGNFPRRAVAEWDPPLAPTKKAKSTQSLNIDYNLEPPPRMKSAAAKARARMKPSQDDSVLSQTTRETSVPPTGVGERKRTVSGQITSSGIPEPGAPQRRSVRLFNQIRPPTNKFTSSISGLGLKDGREIKRARATGTKGRSTATAATSAGGRVVSGTRKQANEAMELDAKDGRPGFLAPNTTNLVHPKSALADKAKEVDAVMWTLDLFSKLAGGFAALCSYRCQDAIQILNSLPPSQRETPWVLSLIGRAYYEQALYSDAENYFVRVRSTAPSSLEDMEVYSTILWHLKNEVELAYLAHELMELDRLSPQAWCAIGNSFSLQGDHDQALKCFKRATQIEPKFAYAFTLQGHEYVSNEEYDKALDAYRHGIGADPRHYNAWYGLGKVYEKMGKYKFAEQHYRTASNINPANGVLVCCIGLILERMGNHKAALLQYGRACSLSPQSFLARFRKARTLMKLNELKNALVELGALKDLVPDEPNVHFLLGKLYKMLQDKPNAIKHFTTALNLDPKAAQFIKDAMESLESAIDDDEDMS